MSNLVVNTSIYQVKTKIPSELSSRVPGGVLDMISEDEAGEVTVPPPADEEENKPVGGYTLNSVKKIDTYSRRIFPCAYILFVLYFFIRYHHIEGALSIEY